jgi:flagellar protein FlaG
MASVSVSHLIIFIASLLVAASVAGTMTTGVDRLTGAIDDESLDLEKTVRSDIEVISDPASPVYNQSGEENITLLVKNTGSNTLPVDPGAFDVLVDGQYRVDVTVTPVTADEHSWHSSEVVQVEISAPGLTAGDHRARLIVGGDEEVFTFRL